MATINKITVLINLLVIHSSSELIEAENTSRKAIESSVKFKEFNQSQDSLVLSNDSLENFNRILNLVTNNSEFQPLFLSIGTFGFGDRILDEIMKYLTERTIDCYRFDLDNFTKVESNTQSRFTWIIVVDKYKNLDSHVHGNPNFWRAVNNFVIIYVGDKANESSNHWLNFFKNLWNRYRIYKILISLIDENFRFLYGYKPFDKANEEFGTVQRIDVLDTSKRSLMIQKKDVGSSINSVEPLGEIKLQKGSHKIFEDFINFNGYPIYVTVFVSVMMRVMKNMNNETSYTMLDANVMDLVEERLQSKFQINVVNSQMDADPFVTALDTIRENGESEIVFTAYLAKLYTKEFVFTASIFEDKVCLIGPSSEAIPKFFMPLLPFAKELWFLLLLYNLVIAVLWLLIQRVQLIIHEGSKANEKVSVDVKIIMLTDRISKRSEIDECFKQSKPQQLELCNSRSCNEPQEIHPWIVKSFDLLTLVCQPLAGGKTNTERGFLFGTLFFGLIVVGLYQSYLVSSLSKPIFYPELDTLSDVAESNRTIITKYKNLQENTFTHGTPITDRLQKKIEISTSLEKTYDMVAYKGFISIGRYSSFQLENLTEYYNKKTNKLLLHLVDEFPATYPLLYPIRLYSPYLTRINDLLLRMQQSGFIQKWYDDMLRQNALHTAKSIPKKSDQHVKLTLEHLSLTFLGLGIGLFCSTIVFLGELYYARRLSCFHTHKSSSNLSNKTTFALDFK